MAAQTSPSLTSTSHTLTATSTMPSDPLASTSHVLALLERLREGNRHAFLQPEAAIPTDSLSLVKETLEAFAGQIGDEQQERLKETRKRKRGGARDVQDEVLKMRKVYVDGFETEQVWQQAKRIIGGVLSYSEDVLEEMRERDEIVEAGQDEDAGDDSRMLEFGQDGFELGSDEDEDEDEDEDDSEVYGSAQEGDEDGQEVLDEEEEDQWEDAEEGEGAEGDDDNEDDDDDDEEEEYVEDPHGLNDGFFSIDDFNRQTQWFEEQDAKGDPNTDAASDDEEVDWAADPMAPSEGKSKKSARDEPSDGEGDDDDDDDDEAGPTFGDMALDAPEGESDDDEDMDEPVDDEGNDFNANEVYYKDFFAPPPRKSKDGKPRPKKQVKFKPTEPDEGDVQRAMDDVRRDLFDDESEADDSEDGLSEVEAGDPKARRSAHERRQAKLADEIRKLEAASVAKREWAMSGEAAATARPMNSLLEEDLDFEHIGKPVPVITPEVTEGIEELIKRRILAQEFDEVLRRRPDVDGGAPARRGLVELDDSKSGKGLAELYEEEHVKKADPDSYVSQSDEKLQKEEREVEAMWRDVSGRLDALSSWHYKPKPSAPSLSVVADVAAVTVEDAQPATALGVAGAESRLAPQEVYKPGAANGAGEAAAAPAPGEVVTRGGVPLARQEMSREDKVRRRRREKERVRKAGGVDAGRGVVSRRAQEKKDTMAELRKGGVKVINRKGEVTDVDGRKAKKALVAKSSSFKL